MPKYLCQAQALIDIVVEAEDMYEADEIARNFPNSKWLEDGKIEVYYDPDEFPEEA